MKKERLEKERKEAEAKAAEEAANEAIRRAKAKQKEKLEKHFNQFDKFDIDFVVGLDSEEKCIIMPGNFEKYFSFFININFSFKFNSILR